MTCTSYSLAGSYNKQFVLTASGYQGAKRAKGALPYRAEVHKGSCNRKI